MTIIVATMWHNGGELMELEDIKVGDVLVLVDYQQRRPLRIAIHNPNYDIYFTFLSANEEQGYIFQLNRKGIRTTHPFRHLLAQVTRIENRLIINSISGPEIEGGTWDFPLLPSGGISGELWAEWHWENGIYKITPHNPIQDSFINWNDENPLEVKE